MQHRNNLINFIPAGGLKPAIKPMAIIKKKDGVFVRTKVEVVECPTTAMYNANVEEVATLRKKVHLMEMLIRSMKDLKHYNEMANIYHAKGQYGMAELTAAKAVSEEILIQQLRGDIAKL